MHNCLFKTKSLQVCYSIPLKSSKTADYCTDGDSLFHFWFHFVVCGIENCKTSLYMSSNFQYLYV